MDSQPSSICPICKSDEDQKWLAYGICEKEKVVVITGNPSQNPKWTQHRFIDGSPYWTDGITVEESPGVYSYYIYFCGEVPLLTIKNHIGIGCAKPEVTHE